MKVQIVRKWCGNPQGDQEYVDIPDNCWVVIFAEVLDRTQTRHGPPANFLEVNMTQLAATAPVHPLVIECDTWVDAGPDNDGDFYSGSRRVLLWSEQPFIFGPLKGSGESWWKFAGVQPEFYLSRRVVSGVVTKRQAAKTHLDTLADNEQFRDLLLALLCTHAQQHAPLSAG